MMDKLDEIRQRAEQLVRIADNPYCLGPAALLDGVKEIVPALLSEIDRLNTVTAEYTSNSAEITINGRQYCPKDAIATLTARAEGAEAERDAAIADWRGFCAKCSRRSKQYLYLSDGQMDAVCATCRANGKCNWEWRGKAGKGEAE